MLALPYNLAEKLPGWYAVMALCIILSVIFFIRAQHAKAKKSPPSVMSINRGFGIFFIALLLTRILFIFSDYERLARDNNTILYNTFVLFGYLSSLVGISILAYVADTYMLESKRRVLTWVAILVTLANAANIVLWVYTQLIPIIVPRLVVYGSTGLVFVMVLLIYGGLARQSTGNLRRNAIITMLGIAIAVAGTLLDSELLLGLVPIYIPPIIMFGGLIIFALGQRQV